MNTNPLLLYYQLLNSSLIIKCYRLRIDLDLKCLESLDDLLLSSDNPMLPLTIAQVSKCR